MAFTTDHIARLGREASSAELARGAAASRFLQRLVAADLAAVHLLTRATNRAPARLLAIVLSKLGNGWIYLILAPVVWFGLGGARSLHVLALGGVCAALLHVLYPIIKRRIGRPRPFHVDPRLPSLLKTLDEHSFPSGHAMTLTGVLVPVVLAWPASTLSAAVLILSMGWSRIAVGHHYPTDVVAGALLGAALAWPISASFFAFW